MRIAAERGMPAPARPRTWPWAAGTVAFVLLALGAAVIGRAIATAQRQASLVVPAPNAPLLPVAAIAHAGTTVTTLTVDSATGHLLALTSDTEPACPPAAACPAATSAQFVVLDGATGARLAATPLTGETAPAAQATTLLVDAARRAVYALSPSAVVRFSTETGQRTGGYSLSGTLRAQRLTGATLDAATGQLYVSDGQRLLALDAASGSLVRSATLQAPAVDGPLLDAAAGRLYVLEQRGNVPTLGSYDARTLERLAGIPLPVGARLGPLDATARTLYLFGADGAVRRAPLDTPRAARGDAPATFARVPALQGALAVGVTSRGGRLFAAFPTVVRALDASGKTLAALPASVSWPATRPLAADDARGLLYLPMGHGDIVIARDGPGITAVDAATAQFVARAALARLLPDTNQDPPFVAPRTFPLAPTAGPSKTGAATRRLDYWIHFAGRGWTGPYPGSASILIVATPGRPGGYTVTFSIAWRQLFDRQHTWVCEVAPDGTVRLIAESGDVVP